MQTRNTTTTGITGTAARGAIDILVQDHVQIKHLLQTLTTAKGADERRTTLEQLKELLTIHNATEENFVYPAIEKVAGKKLDAEHLYHETAQADVVVFELDTCLNTGDTSGFAANAQKLRDAVLEHIGDEEQKAFPTLREKADPEQTKMLDNAVRKFRSSLRFAPTT
ncbi:MAG TPA: hemerythrin domain-containing protein [Candidatus Lustribacter sp.]